MTDWIKVTDRLPDKDALCIVHAETADDERPLITTAWYDPSGWGWSLMPSIFISSITHWMPMPEPPEKPT